MSHLDWGVGCEGEDIPPKDATDKEVPEKVETLQEQKRGKYLPFHPPHHPDALSGLKTTPRLPIGPQSGKYQRCKCEMATRTGLGRNLCTQNTA